MTQLGRDVVACAPTGSGKTAAFALPILHRFAEDPFAVYAIILTPTRYLLELEALNMQGACFSDCRSISGFCVSSPSSRLCHCWGDGLGDGA